MAVAFAPNMRWFVHAVLLVFALMLGAPSALAAAAEADKAEKNRRKPLQRCDQLKGDAELECLKKARERVVEARQKRESGKSDESSNEERKKPDGGKGDQSAKGERKD
jgi:hypothetical protein